MSNAINEGDIVHLKSGGPRMTVQELDGDGAYCIWFDGDGKKQGARFRISNLEPTD
jgi:uncharacterized protein YodC (DUF2158 family)